MRRVFLSAAIACLLAANFVGSAAAGPCHTVSRGWKTPRHVFETYGHAMEDRTLTEALLKKTP